MKKLLKESEIRKMMKFANIGALSNDFVEKLNEGGVYDEDADPLEEEEIDEGLYAAIDEQELDEPDLDEPVDMSAADEPGLDEPDLDEPELDEPDLDEPEMAAGPGISVESALEGLSAFLEGVSDPEVGPQLAEKIDVQLTDAEEPAGEFEGPLPGEEEEGALPPELEPAAEEPGPEDELEEAQIEVQEDDDFVNEIVRKVAKRLLRK